MFKLCHTVSLISHASKVKFFKLGINSMWTENFQIYKLNFKKGRGTRDQIANIHGIIEKASEFNKKKKNNFGFIDYVKAFDCVDHNKLQNQATLPV